MKKNIRIALLGNPNVGKTSLLNSLAGLNLHVGNWPGKTVQKKEAKINFNNYQFQITDLPGTYSLFPYSEEEKISRDFIIKENPDLIVQVIDANSFFKNLFLFFELLALKKKIIIALNFNEEAKKNGIKINEKEIEKILKVQIVKIEANKGEGNNKLLQTIIKTFQTKYQNPNYLTSLLNPKGQISHSKSMIFIKTFLSPFYSQIKIKTKNIDSWVLNKLNETINTVDKLLENYEFSKAISEINLFFWDLCDNYLEIIKDRLYNPDVRGEQSRASAQYTLYHTFNSILKMYSVFIPYITEELYNAFFIDFEKIKSIHLSGWPKLVEVSEKIDDDLVNEIYRVISIVRTYKSNNSLSLKTEIETMEIKSEKNYTGFLEDLKAVTKAKNIVINKDLENPEITQENISLNIKLS